MRSTSPGPALLIVAVAVSMALLIGWVGSAERGASAPRELGALTRSSARPRENAVLVAPVPEPSPAAADDLEPSGSSSTKVIAAPNAREPGPKQVVLTGLVLRPDGAPAASARVWLGRQVARCTAEGRFQMAFSTGAEGDDLVAFEPGFEPAVRRGVGSMPGGPLEVRLVLGAETLSLSGRVIARDDRPLKRWVVELDGPDVLQDYGLREEVRTDGDGRFVLSDVPAGVHVVRAWRERRELAYRSAPASAGEVGLTIVAESDE